MDDPTTFTICRDDVSFNHFDAEVIVIHLTRGTYFSLRDTAGVIWGRLEAGPSSARLLASLFTTPGPEVERSISAFLDELTAHGLVTPDHAPGVSAEAPETPHAFSPPTVEVFDDLEGLLLADPVHEVSDEGWPSVARAEPEAA